MNMKINVIIPAAGAASRLRPLSSNTSKIMVRVNGKPCLDYILEQLNKICTKSNIEINEIVIVDGRFSDTREYCAIKHPHILFVKQENFTGPYDAISLGFSRLSSTDLPVVVWLGDAIILDDNLPLGTDFLLATEVENQTAWCMWNRAGAYYNKPTKSIDDAIALVGLYSFNDGEIAAHCFQSGFDRYDISKGLEDYPYIFKPVITNKWYDIGDLPTYYKTSAELLNMKSRAFNTMSYDSKLGLIHKSENYHVNDTDSTLRKEKAWYTDISDIQSLFVPRFIKHPTDLVLTYEAGTLLSDLMLYENLPVSTWEYIIDKLINVKLDYFNEPSLDVEFNKEFSKNSYRMWSKKLVDRYNSSSVYNQFDGYDNYNLYQKMQTFAEEVSLATKPISGMHGDLHFGNIIYNQQTDLFKFIDPRGCYGIHWGSCGDNIYDFAKLAHDLHLGYNAMVADVPQNMDVRDIFLDKLDEYNLPKDIILKGGAVLLYGCVPLHYDDPERQRRFVNRVKRICER